MIPYAELGIVIGITLAIGVSIMALIRMGQPHPSQRPRPVPPPDPKGRSMFVKLTQDQVDQATQSHQAGQIKAAILGCDEKPKQCSCGCCQQLIDIVGNLVAVLRERDSDKK